MDRPNFGITYEPANLELCGQDYGAATLQALAPWIFNVYVQNHRLHAGGADRIETWCRGPVPFDQIPLWEGGGIDFPLIFRLLAVLGYDGWVTVHQASAALGGAGEAARRSAAYLRGLGSFDAG